MDVFNRSVTVVCITLLVFVSLSTAFEGCLIKYGRRGCVDKVHQGVIVTCDGDGGFHGIPDKIPPDTVYISLINFKFGNLTRQDMEHLRSVECMNIKDSFIDSLAVDTFSDLEKLHELELRDTPVKSKDIRFINHPEFRAKLVTIAGTGVVNQVKLDFNGTVSLQKFEMINLAGNNVNFVHPSILSHMANLRFLSLSDNNLNQLDWAPLTNMPNLNKLYLDGNHFQTIPDYVKNVFGAVKDLKLARNPFHCNCKLRWLKDFYETTEDKLLDYDEVSCASPFAKPMKEAFEEEFVCGKPSQPVIHWKKLRENEYVVNCSSMGEPAPTLTLTFPDYRKLVTPPKPDLSQLETSSPRIITSVGDVICEAANTEGVVITTEIIPASGAAITRSILLHVITFCALLFTMPSSFFYDITIS